MINNVIKPELAEYGRQATVEDEEKWYKILNEDMDSITIAPPDHIAIAWAGMNELDSMKKLVAKMDPMILGIIEEYRPKTPTTYDQDIIDVLEYAGIPY